MDVYFEKIAGVAEHNASQAEEPAKLELEDTGPPPPTQVEPVGLDENGFPVNPLREQDHLWFVQAAQLYRPLERCASTARTSGLLLIIAGAFTAAIAALAFDLVMLVIGVILITLGTMERGGATDMQAIKLTAPRRLAWTQIMLFAVIALYCGAQMNAIHTDPQQAMSQWISADTAAALEKLPIESAALPDDFAKLLPTAAFWFYGFVALVSLLFQGSMAIYYASRRRRVRLFHTELPPWVVDIMKTVTTS